MCRCLHVHASKQQVDWVMYSELASPIQLQFNTSTNMLPKHSGHHHLLEAVHAHAAAGAPESTCIAAQQTMPAALAASSQCMSLPGGRGRM